MKTFLVKSIILVLVISLLSIQSCTYDKASASNNIPAYSKWHTITLPFTGPETSETAVDNPFLNYRLTVAFQHEASNQTIRGFYAAAAPRFGLEFRRRKWSS
jgi:hypothetical protein